MGFGHRIYKVRDPRADVLKEAVAKLPETAGRLAYAVGGRAGRDRGAAQAQARPPARHQRRVLHRAAARGAGDPARGLHRAVRRRPRRRLVRPRLRAGEGRPHHPAAIELCRRAPVVGRRALIADPRQVRARVPSASNTQTIRSAPVGVKRTLKWRRQKLPSAKANSASVPSDSGRTVSVADARLGPGLGRDQLGHAVHHRPEAQRLAVGRGLHRPAVDAQPDRGAAVLGADREVDGERAWIVEIDMRHARAADRCPRAGSSGRSARAPA